MFQVQKWAHFLKEKGELASTGEQSTEGLGILSQKKLEIYVS